MRRSSLVAAFIAVTAVNFAASAVLSMPYGVAVERSYFQGVALLMVWLNDAHPGSAGWLESRRNRRG